MAGGAFRGGHMRPTFDTAVEFISVNQTATDKSGGYGSPQTIRGEWGAPEVMTETTVAHWDNFDPVGDSGVQATDLGIFVWYTEGDAQTLIFTPINSDFGSVKTRQGGGEWTQWSTTTIIGDANRSRTPLPLPVTFHGSTTNNIPSEPGMRIGVLIDDATGQSLYYCNNIDNLCEHLRRAIDDGLGPASRTYLADVKDIAGAERVVGDQTVAVSTKSLVFAHATLKPLLAAETSLAKEWKVRIGNREMDIVGVMDGWVPNRYTRLIVEDRT